MPVLTMQAVSDLCNRGWGKIAFIGEGGSCTFQPSPDLIHGQKTIYESWVTSLWRMGELWDIDGNNRIKGVEWQKKKRMSL